MTAAVGEQYLKLSQLYIHTVDNCSEAVNKSVLTQIA